LEGANLENEEQKDTTETKEAYKQLEEAHIHLTQNLFLECCKAFGEDYKKISGFIKYPEVWQSSDATIEEHI